MRAEEKLKEDGFEFVQEISSGGLIERGYEWEEEDMTCRSWKLYAKAIGNITILKVADGTEIKSVERISSKRVLASCERRGRFVEDYFTINARCKVLSHYLYFNLPF